ncbi:GNAT family N-acetyltransferase [Amycolatopsis sp. YIM 10]|uniref:GNAT family N-acetyltransferase n=1 Tax=Amycolatopsis sp. YIM 10 TaxID=2653857 RepID=UPI0012A7DD42|nr:GNAT family N-acetyltransferase [Amycolatopsis sp. YIM 10]QFU91564.1 Acetyltransferase (GNAT) family protein [Amycolatopsis sp. YIM 10]
MSFAGLDPLLPEPGAPAGERVHARVRDGRQVSAVLYRSKLPAGAVERLFSPARTWEVTPLLDAGDTAGLRALLPRVRVRLLAERPGADSACVLAWPSLDAPVAGVLPRYGFLPRTAIGVRVPSNPATPAESPSGLVVRPAKEADLEELLALEVAELRYAALVGTARPLDNATTLLEPGLRRLLAEGHVWIAEADGLAVGMASTRCLLPEAGGPLANRLPGGRWGYVSTLSVAEDARGGGVGRALMAVAHRALAESGVRGTFLFYNPCNPLSSVFWHRQGYRPLWTIWDVTPAGEMRA